MPIPKIVVTLALMAVQAGLQMTQKVRGPRLDNLKTTTAEYGTPIPRFWGTRKFEVPVIWAADLIETKHTSKGKAGKNTQYKYYADFAVLICDHEIDAVTKIWMDDKLVYQSVAAGPVSVGAVAGLTVGGNMRIYLGTETQDADPLIEAWCDDKYGANSCPAYRGSSYVVFERLPVNNFGNRIPNITIEAVSNKSTAYIWATVAKPGNLSNKQLDVGTTRLYLIAGTSFQVVDIATSTLLIDQTVTAGFDVGAPYAITPSGIYGTGGSDVVLFGLDGGSRALGYTGVAGWAGCSYADGQVLFYPSGVIGNYAGTLGAGTITAIPVGHMPTHYFTNVAGDSVAVGTTTGNILSIASPATAMATLINTTAYSSSGPAYGFDNGTNYVVRQGTHLFLVDYSFAIVGHTTDAGPGGLFESFDAISPGATSFWNGATHYDSSDLSVIETANPASWAVTLPGAAFEVVGFLYDPISDALVSLYNGAGALQGLIIRYLHRIGSNGVTLQTVVDKVSDWVGLTGQDSSALTQTVLGYSVTQGTGKDMIGPLLDIHDVDARPHDFQVQFKNRGSAPSGSMILTEDFVRADNRYTVTIKQDTDLPRKLTFNFADIDHEQQPNNSIAQRPFDAIDTSREETVDLSTWADTADGAQQKADRYLRRVWNSRETVKNALTAQHLDLEPGDVKAISLDGVARNVRLDKLTYSQTGLECEWIRDEVTVAALNSDTSGAPIDNSDPQTITVPDQTRGIIIDGPLVQDSDNDVNPILYYAAGSYGGTWMGATVNEGTGGDYETIASVDSTLEDTWGLAQSALPTANPNLWDRGNTLSVMVFGTLASATEAEIDADTTLNLFALGDDDRWEYIQFSTATLTGTSGNANVYTLSGFKRGRRGTEGNVATHTTTDLFLLLNRAIPIEMGTGEIGEDLSFKVQSLGRDIDSAPPIDLIYDGNSLKPYAPARVKWVYDGTDLQGTIFRRTRVGGAWNGSTIALGETSEAYEVDIYNGATFKRTISVSGTNMFTYTAAMAGADGITLPTPPTIQAYQMSSTVGRGFALAA